jgi:hypothetical protein
MALCCLWQVKACGAHGCTLSSTSGIVLVVASALAMVAALLWECKVLYVAHVDLQPAFQTDALLFFGDKDMERNQAARKGCVCVLVTGATVSTHHPDYRPLLSLVHHCAWWFCVAGEAASSKATPGMVLAQCCTSLTRTCQSNGSSSFPCLRTK